MWNQIQFGTGQLKNNFRKNPEPRVLKYEKSCPELDPRSYQNFKQSLNWNQGFYQNKIKS